VRSICEDVSVRLVKHILRKCEYDAPKYGSV
jgi:ribosomal protein L7Ae-like RNA K-turn-binding protein